MRQAGSDLDRFLATLARAETGLAGNGRSWLAPIRQEAIARFAALGFPTTRDEAWRCTSVAPITRHDYALAPGARADALTPEVFERLTFEPWDCTHLVFVNGRFAPEASRIRALPDGVTVGSLAEAIARHRDLVEPHLARYADFREHAFTALNTALLKDGAFVHVPRGKAVEDPIHVLFVSVADGRAVMSHPRNLIVVGDGGRATVLESYAGFARETYLTNAVTEIAVGRNAAVDHYLLQREGEAASHVGRVQCRLGRDATFSSHVVSLGGALIRNEVGAVLDAEGADCTLNGLYITHGSQHVDNHTTIDHAKSHGSSRELYKGVLDGRSRGVFEGTIIVRPDAQKTDARQVNKNLLISEDALVDSKPTLRIHADDVRCTHAATIGQLEEDALFYIRSRGVGEEAARNLLIQAFVADIVGRIRIDRVRTGLECLLFTRLHDTHGRGLVTAP
ncbi:MAG: Fe-S cluster assembly protein SufD [Acidobacteriota bacterium]